MFLGVFVGVLGFFSFIFVLFCWFVCLFFRIFHPFLHWQTSGVCSNCSLVIFYCLNRCIYLLLILKGRLGDDLCLSTVTFVVRLISVPLVTSYFAIVSVYVYLLYSIIHGLESFSPPPITVFSFFSLSVIFIPLGISSWVNHYP